MGLIYASFTIIAAAGKNPSYGLPGVSTAPRKYQPSITVGHLVLASAANIGKEIQDSKWQSRGWTYQEAILSRRRLVFTDSGVYYQCLAMHCHEGIYTPLEALHISSLQRFSANVNIWKVFPDERIGKSWMEFAIRVREYASRQLSKDIDALDAFQGVLEVFKNQEKPTSNICGMPLFPREIADPESRARITDTSLLSFSLTWKARFSSTTSRRREFPSWTWLGWAGMDFHGWGTCHSHKQHYYGHHTILGLEEEDNLIKIEVEISTGIIMDWEQNRSIIERHLRPHGFPQYLHIRGWVFDIQLPGPSFDPTWEFFDRPSFRVLTLGNANDFEEIAEFLHFNMDDRYSTGQRLIGLLMRHPERYLRNFEVIFLVFDPQINAFERLGCGEIFTKSRLQEVSLDNGTIGTWQLKKEVVRLG
jgi:hypothetical protein